MSDYRPFPAVPPMRSYQTPKWGGQTPFLEWNAGSRNYDNVGDDFFELRWIGADMQIRALHVNTGSPGAWIQTKEHSSVRAAMQHAAAHNRKSRRSRHTSGSAATKKKKPW